MKVLIGNIIALIASIIMVYYGLVKNKKKILFLQLIQLILCVISNIILSSFSGAIINALSCVRNVLAYKDKFGKKEKTIIIVLSTVLSVIFNNIGFIGLLPVISMITYICFMDTKDILNFKLLIIFTLLMWGIHDFYIKSYTSSIFNFVSIFTNGIAILQLSYKDLKKEGK